VNSRVITAQQDIPTGAGGRIAVPAEIERYEKAPNLYVTTSKTAKFTIAEGFDGMKAWALGPNGNVNDVEPPFQERAKRSSGLYEAVDFKNRYTSLSNDGIEKVNNRDAYVLIGFVKDDTPDRLYFDKETGLLLRRQSVVATPYGDQPAEMDYDDYRATPSGVKIPYRIHMVPASSGSALATQSTFKITKVQENVPVDDAKFARPASKQPAKQP
jgi:hypothetical protein